MGCPKCGSENPERARFCLCGGNFLPAYNAAFSRLSTSEEGPRLGIAEKGETGGGGIRSPDIVSTPGAPGFPPAGAAGFPASSGRTPEAWPVPPGPAWIPPPPPGRGEGYAPSAMGRPSAGTGYRDAPLRAAGWARVRFYLGGALILFCCVVILAAILMPWKYW